MEVARRRSQFKPVKAGLQVPVGRIGRYLKKARYSRVGIGAPVPLAVVLEYLAAEKKKKTQTIVA